MRIGEIVNGNLYLRCPYCGDSENTENAHWGIHLKKFVHHCYRCGAGGKLSLRQALELVGTQALTTSQFRSQMGLEEFEAQILPGPATGRYSALDRFHLGGDDVFPLRDPIDRETIGYLVRRGPSNQRQNKNLAKARVVGIRGLGIPNSCPVVSSPSHPYRLVEGPFDVLQSTDIAVGGLVGLQSIKDFRGHFLILCPDGDVWQKPDLLYNMTRLISDYLKNLGKYPSILAIEVLPPDKDPDEVPPEDRVKVLFDEFPRLLKTLKRKIDYYAQL